MPFGFIKNLNHPQIIYNTKNQWFGESLEGAKQYIEALHLNNIQVIRPLQNLDEIQFSFLI